VGYKAVAPAEATQPVASPDGERGQA
jgi:hypothetical protein